MRTTRVDHKNAIRSFVHPDAVLLLPLGVNAKRVIRRKANGKLAGWLENRTRQEEPQKHEKTGSKKSNDGRPNNSSPHFIDRRLWCAFDDGTCRSGRDFRCRWQWWLYCRRCSRRRSRGDGFTWLRRPGAIRCSLWIERTIHYAIPPRENRGCTLRRCH